MKVENMVGRRISAVLGFLSLIVSGVAAAQPSGQGTQATQNAVDQATLNASIAAAERRAAQLGDRLDLATIATNTGIDWGRGEAVINAPFETVRAIVNDYGRYQDFLPNFRVSRVLSRRGQNALVYMQASVIRNTTTLWAQLRIFARRPQGATQVVEARMTEGNMERFQARWELTPIDGGRRTLVSFQILVEPDLPLPDSLFTEENQKAARKTIQALRRRAAEPGIARLAVR